MECLIFCLLYWVGWSPIFPQPVPLVINRGLHTVTAQKEISWKSKLNTFEVFHILWVKLIFCMAFLPLSSVWCEDFVIYGPREESELFFSMLVDCSCIVVPSLRRKANESHCCFDNNCLLVLKLLLFIYNYNC